jgi:iron complex outermembrane receptor protein
MFQNLRFVLLSGFLVFSAVQNVFSQLSLKGKIKDSATGNTLEAAFVGLEGTGKVVSTGADGSFEFQNLKPGKYVVKASLLGYFPFSQKIDIKDNLEFDIKLETRNSITEEVIVSATRSKSSDPTTSTLIDKDDIAKVNLGQDLPILIQMAPSVVSTSDAGGGVGYTGVSIRGSDATRINVTMNGIPVNDAESHGLFWVNMPDFASSVSNIQIQRGVGTSTNGSAAFGASLNIQTSTLRKDAYIETNNSYGSFNTIKNNVLVGTGLIDGKWSVDGRFSAISSDGFIDRGSAALRSNYLSAGYHGKRGVLKFNLISGSEKTYQAWNGIPESRLRGDQKGMQDYITRNFISSVDSAHLVNSNSRTFNSFTYKNQTDNYTQNHFQLLYSYDLAPNWVLNTALHYTKGKGYYEEFKTGEGFEKYGLQTPIIGNDTITSTDLIRQRWLNNDFYGTTYSIQYDKEKLNFTFGGSANQYVGDHYGNVIWAQISKLKDNTFQYYFNDARKTDLSNYAKLGYQLNSKLRFYLDLQLRYIDYSFLGFDQNLKETTQSVNYTFFNPKAGISYQIREKQMLYLSYGKSEREPVRDDFINSSPQSRPKSEVLHNIEAGWKAENQKSRIALNGYGMFYQNQLVLTGQINDVGAYIRSNVKESYRAGIELDAAYKILPVLQIGGNITYSRNVISNFNYFLDNYDNADGKQNLEVFKSTPIAFSPDIISAAEVSWIPVKNLETALMAKYVGRSFLDNTGSNEKSLNPYQFLNFRASYRLYLPFVKEISFQVLVNNILNQKYETNGYTFGYISGGQRVTENFYFPQAGTNFLAGFSLKL